MVSLQFLGQANKWIKNVEKTNGLKTVQYTNKSYMTVLAEAISTGIVVLLENMRKTFSNPQIEFVPIF